MSHQVVDSAGGPRCAGAHGGQDCRAEGRVQLSEVVFTHHITGNFDYLLQVEVADLPAYEDFHANHMATLPGVATVTSYVSMKTLSAETT